MVTREDETEGRKMKENESGFWGWGVVWLLWFCWVLSVISGESGAQHACRKKKAPPREKIKKSRQDAWGFHERITLVAYSEREKGRPKRKGGAHSTKSRGIQGGIGRVKKFKRIGKTRNYVAAWEERSSTDKRRRFAVTNSPTVRKRNHPEFAERPTRKEGGESRCAPDRPAMAG